MRATRALVFAALLLGACQKTAPKKFGDTNFGPRPGGGGSGSGTVTSVAATAGGLLAVAGTPTVAPTVGLASLAASSFICNATGGGAVPTACGVGTGLSFSGATLNMSAIPLASLANAGAASILGATGAGAHADLTGTQALTVIINATTTVVTVAGAAVQDVDFSGLAGDTDGGYECKWYAPSGFAAGSYMSLQPNADAGNAESTGAYQSHADGVDHGQPVGSMAMGVGGSSTATGYFRFASKTGRGNRLFTSEWHDAEGGTDYKYEFLGWYTAAGAITSVRIHHPAAAGIPIGTVFVFRKLGEL